MTSMDESWTSWFYDLEAAGDCSFSLEEENKFDSNLCRDHNNNNDSYGSFCISSFNNPTCQVPVVDDMVKEEADLGSKQSESRINSKARERQRGEGNDHIIAERMRRKKITQHFIALSALIPGLKKVDKATVLEEAIKYVKELEEQVKVLEEKSKMESVELEDGKKWKKGEGEVEAKVSGKDVLIGIECEKQKGGMMKIITEIQNLHLSVMNSSVVPFGTSILHITIIAQVKDEFSLSAKEIATKLRLALFN